MFKFILFCERKRLIFRTAKSFFGRIFVCIRSLYIANTYTAGSASVGFTSTGFSSTVTETFSPVLKNKENYLEHLSNNKRLLATKASLHKN